MQELLIRPAPLFVDRSDAGRALAAELEGERGPELVVLGLARGGVDVAAEVARALSAPLDVVAVRKIGHPLQPEYGIGAVTPGDGVYVRAPDGLTEEELAAAVEGSKGESGGARRAPARPAPPARPRRQDGSRRGRRPGHRRDDDRGPALDASGRRRARRRGCARGGG